MDNYQNYWTDECNFSNISGGKVSAVTIGYFTFVVSPSLATALLQAAALGHIKEAERVYKDSRYQIIVKGVPTVQVEHLDTLPDNAAEIAKLKQRLQELEDSNA